MHLNANIKHGSNETIVLNATFEQTFVYYIYVISFGRRKKFHKYIHMHNSLSGNSIITFLRHSDQRYNYLGHQYN